MVIPGVHKLNYGNVNTEVTNRKQSGEWQTPDLICDWILRTMRHVWVCAACTATSWTLSYNHFGIATYPALCFLGLLLIVYIYYLFPKQDRKHFWDWELEALGRFLSATKFFAYGNLSSNPRKDKSEKVIHPLPIMPILWEKWNSCSPFSLF